MHEPTSNDAVCQVHKVTGALMKISMSMPLSVIADTAGFELPEGSTTNGWEHVRTLLSASNAGEDLHDIPASFWELLHDHLKAKAKTSDLRQRLETTHYRKAHRENRNQ